ncbi:MAG: 6-carboxytetrahydropterin synthase [Nitrospirae bacterium]|nr:6-carboxytetrahydropterin synthase [Nitrospirota bacterium]
MSKSTLTKRIEFSASHRYHNDAWDAQTNQHKFGPCNNEPSHGHNYLLELTVRGDVDHVTGMIINLYDLKRILLQVIEEFDHKHLNLDTPYFQTRIPTTENIAHVLWGKFSQQPETHELERLRLFEGDELFAEIAADCGGAQSVDADSNLEAVEARITRIYGLPIQYASTLGNQLGKSYRLAITVRGPIATDTGRVTDIAALDHLVAKTVLGPYRDQLVTNTKEFEGLPFSSESFAKMIGDQIKDSIEEGQLEKITLQDSHGDLVEYEVFSSA